MTIYTAALKAVLADNAVRTSLRIRPDGLLIVGNHQAQIGPAGVYAIAIGKAAVGMMAAVVETLGGAFTAGLAVSKSESALRDPRVTTMHGSHPVPDTRSLAAGQAVLAFADSVPSGAVVLCLVSGGGSSLVESLREGVELDHLRDVTSALLRAGASIHELNAVRSRMSRLKAGGLLAALSHARIYNLIVSDVLHDDPRTIASGPSVPAKDVDAEDVARIYGIPDDLHSAFARPEVEFPPTTIIANLSIALDAAAEAAAAMGYAPVVMTRSLDGEARETGRMFASILSDSAARLTTFSGRTCLLAGGETTVTVRGNGVGGRNTEAALAAAIRLSGVTGAALGCLATDGDDGTTGAAGGIVDGVTVGSERRIEAVQALAQNDSFGFLRDAGSAVITGPTGTNVNDLLIGLLS